ncbi:carbohydrate porin [Edaphobacter modestus]|uniref:Carbohydrate-selective porin (OprB family) n=1 Tax=Edaphobacter modestus TaxID=388466 RepID=A0A4Q7YSN1_9BACT|nr:carbohydrate porin [Edaphobacter modestus]RZU39865.1 carbohydrate-selective porin (OprB family) [Edaphobacter modestus]
MRSLTLFLVVALTPFAVAQTNQFLPAQPDSSTSLPDAPSADAPTTIFPHPERLPYLIAGQANIVFQAHGPFHSPYDGPNSLQDRGEYKTSLVGTLFLGLQLHRNPRYATDVIADFESAGGRGISQALGLAGFTNLDVVRNPNLGSKPYLARIQIHQVIGLPGNLVETDRTPYSLSTQLPERRFELHVGKMSLPDYFDVNSIGSDSHLQFLNWTVDNNGAWDYAADTRGYTYGAVLEYRDRSWSARYALAAMPTVANGIDLDWAFSRASGQNFEFELRRSLLGHLAAPERKGTLRVLSFVNHAHMGLYRDAVNAFLSGQDPKPNIAEHAKFGSVKYGFAINAEQEITSNLRTFLRVGWNEGQHESFAYTEVDQTVAFGGDYSGRAFSRPNDKIGLAFVSNAIKRDHQNYLHYGGLGFLLGDGNLNYAREDILESYYNLHAWRGVFYALNLQFIDHPGYNKDRGPVLVEAVRMHVDF